MNILILSDSLALPRLHPEFCHLNQTWPALLRKQGHQVTQISIGGGTSHDLAIQCNYYRKETIDIDLVIVQSGIVDCAPRFARKMELKLYKVIPVIGTWIIRLLNRNWVRKMRGITYMSLKKYTRNISSLQHNFDPYPVLFLGILPASDTYEAQLAGIKKNTERYNSVLRSMKHFVDLSGIPAEGIMNDFHHLNTAGHAFVFDQLATAIEKLK